MNRSMRDAFYELPSEAMVLWDKAQEVFLPGTVVAWTGRHGEDYGIVHDIVAEPGGRGITLQLGGYDPRLPRAARIPIWRADGYSLPVHPVNPRRWVAPYEEGFVGGVLLRDFEVQALRRVLQDPMFWAKFEEAKQTFHKGDLWVYGRELRGMLWSHEVRILDTGDLRSPMRFRVVMWAGNDQIVSLWPAAPINLMEEPDLPTDASWATPNPRSLASRRHWAVQESKRRSAREKKLSHALDQVGTHELEAVAQPVAYHVTDFRFLPSIRKHGLPADSYLTTEAGLMMWVQWLTYKMRDLAGLEAKPVVLRVDTRGLPLRLDGTGTADAIEYVYAHAQKLDLHDVVAVRVPVAIPADRILWARPHIAASTPRRGTRQYDVQFPAKWRRNPREYPWLDLRTIERWVPAMEQQGVSAVARSSRGFLSAYRKVNGDYRRLPVEWQRKRQNFIARHMAQVTKRDEPLYRGGEPTRRHLALIAWAYSPDPRFNRKK